jgi:hypothetical protein
MLKYQVDSPSARMFGSLGYAALQLEAYLMAPHTTDSQGHCFLMSGIHLLCVVAGLAGTAVLSSGETARIVSDVVPGTSTMVVVAEGDYEPRSLGSYSIRAYGGANPRFPYDDFIAGTVRSRDGTVDHILFSDLNHDGSPEIVVIMRSVGSGGYLSADAFHLQGTTLLLVESVSGLAKDADPLRALEAKLANRAGPCAPPDAGAHRH